jgi:hypothetical protein
MCNSWAAVRLLSKWWHHEHTFHAARLRHPQVWLFQAISFVVLWKVHAHTCRAIEISTSRLVFKIKFQNPIRIWFQKPRLLCSNLGVAITLENGEEVCERVLSILISQLYPAKLPPTWRSRCYSTIYSTICKQTNETNPNKRRRQTTTT